MPVLGTDNNARAEVEQNLRGFDTMGKNIFVYVDKGDSQMTSTNLFDPAEGALRNWAHIPKTKDTTLIAMLNRHKDEQFFQNLVGTVASISTDCTVMDIEGTDTQHLAPIMQWLDPVKYKEFLMVNEHQRISMDQVN